MELCFLTGVYMGGVELLHRQQCNLRAELTAEGMKQISDIFYWPTATNRRHYGNFVKLVEQKLQKCDVFGHFTHRNLLLLLC